MALDPNQIRSMASATTPMAPNDRPLINRAIGMASRASVPGAAGIVSSFAPMLSNTPVGDIAGGLTQAGGGLIKSAPFVVGAGANYATEPVLNLMAGAVGGQREDPRAIRNASDAALSDAASNIPQGLSRAGIGVRNLFGLQPASQPTAKPVAAKPAASPATEPAGQTKAEQDAMLANPRYNPELDQDPRMMARPGFTVGEQPTTSARSPVQNYLDDLASQRAENAAIRAQALQDLQDASRLDTSSVGNMVVSAAKGRRKGMAAKAALGSVEAMDPNKFISPVVQQGMQSEASRYTADAGAAASRFTAQSAAAAKADDRALKAQLEGPKAAQEAMLARMLAQAGGDIEKISEISAAYKGTPGAAYSVTQDLNGGLPYVTPQRGMLKGTPLKGGVRAEFERNAGAELAAKMNSLKTAGEKDQFESSLEEYQKQILQNYIDSKKAK